MTSFSVQKCSKSQCEKRHSHMGWENMKKCVSNPNWDKRVVELVILGLETALTELRRRHIAKQAQSTLNGAQCVCNGLKVRHIFYGRKDRTHKFCAGEIREHGPDRAILRTRTTFALFLHQTSTSAWQTFPPFWNNFQTDVMTQNKFVQYAKVEWKVSTDGLTILWSVPPRSAPLSTRSAFKIKRFYGRVLPREQSFHQLHFSLILHPDTLKNVSPCRHRNGTRLTSGPVVCVCFLVRTVTS